MEIVFRYKFKLVSAAMTLIVMALIRTDASPALWQVSLVALMFYGINCLIIEAAVDEIRRSRRRQMPSKSSNT